MSTEAGLRAAAAGIDLRQWPALFVTGTDTGVGKTQVACALLLLARQQGLRAAGFKPVASGAYATPQGLRNEDAERLLAHSTPGLAYAQVNPQVFALPVAPHLAARQAGRTIDLSRIDEGLASLRAQHDCVIVEGAGGWRVPLDDRLDFSDWVAARRLPVILVVGLRLGCINHAMLTAESILRRAPLAGWIANCLPPPQPLWEDNVETLRRRLEAPLLGVMPAGVGLDAAAQALARPADDRVRSGLHCARR